MADTTFTQQQLIFNTINWDTLHPKYDKLTPTEIKFLINHFLTKTTFTYGESDITSFILETLSEN